ncbi:hypothetical protein [Moraxella bovis]|uniref:Uncharacterized protein n=1 Tax=Moraxella bovis TaxID=476 RepID=A0A378PXD2_MORBO|nr:hypothetical protein [Moraxella bovis]STY93221.1 Uncharacterised protein [Moraxella bovis]
MIKTLIFLTGLFIAIMSYADPNSDELGVCYLFDGDELKQKDVCVISSSYSFGYAEHTFKLNGIDYEFSYDMNLEIGEMAKNYGMYKRDNFYMPYPYDDEMDSLAMTCFKTEPYDFCYKE